MSSPILSPDYNYLEEGFRYGNWTGGGYSAADNSGSFVPYTSQQKLVPAYDNFDAVSKAHDIAYEQAQQNFIKDIATGRDISDSVKSLQNAITVADQVFVSANQNVVATTEWGEQLRYTGSGVMNFKATMQTAITDELNDSNSSLAQEFDSYDTPQLRSEFQTLFNKAEFIRNESQKDPSNNVIEQYSTDINNFANENPLLQRVGNIGNVFMDAVSADPTVTFDLVIDGAIFGGDLMLFVGQYEIINFAGEIDQTLTVSIDGTDYNLSSLLGNFEDSFNSLKEMAGSLFYAAENINTNNAVLISNQEINGEQNLVWQTIDGDIVTQKATLDSNGKLQLVEQTEIYGKPDGSTFSLDLTYNNFDSNSRSIGLPDITRFELPSGSNVVGQIGTTFGSQLGQLLGGDALLEQIGARTAGNLIGEAIGAALGDVSESILGFAEFENESALVDAFKGMISSEHDLDLSAIGDVTAAQGIAVLTSLLMAEVFDSLGLDGIDGQVITQTTANITSQLLSNSYGIATGATKVVNGQTVDVGWADGFSQTELLQGLQGVGEAIIGNYLASQVVNYDNEIEALFATVGATVGAYLAANIPGLTTIASFLGNVAGSGLYEGLDAITGGWLGETVEDDPYVYRYVTFDHNTNLYIDSIDNEVRKETGSFQHVVDNVQNLTTTHVNTLNGIIGRIGGKVDDSFFDDREPVGNQDAKSGALREGIDYREGIEFYHPYYGYHHGNDTETGHDDYKVVLGIDDENYYVNANGDQERLLRIGLEYELRNVSFVGGDLVLMKVHEDWKAAHNSWGEGDKLALLMNDIAAAESYRNYLENTEEINVLNNALQGTAFQSTWAASFTQIQTLGLNEGYLVQSIAGLTPGSVTDLMNTANNYLAADGDDTIFGYAGNDTITGYGGNDIINGGSDNDSIVAGAGKDSIYGENGNDHIIAGDGDDFLQGGEGADTLDGGRGYDTALYNSAASAVNVTMIEGVGSFAGEASGDILYSIEQVSGSNFDDTITGSDRDDVINGLVGNDLLVSKIGDDTVYGWEGNDTIDGGDGNDLIAGEHGSDLLIGGNGDDLLLGDNDVVTPNGQDTLLGGNGNDTLVGGALNDSLDGGEGNDDLNGGSGSDTLLGGSGDDLLNGENDDDSIRAGAGNDAVYGSNGNDIIFGETGLNTLFGDYGDDTIFGGDMVDYIFGSYDNDSIEGGDGNDVLAGEDGDDFISGENGNDVIYTDGPLLTYGATYAGNDTADGGAGDDLIKTGERDDTVIGGSGNDWLFGENGNDVMFGGSDDDTMNAGAGNDLAYGDSGDDSILGYEGDDTIFGGTGNDGLYGLSGNDSIDGEDGDDILLGDSGDDILIGNAGADSVDGWSDNDSILGGAGNDTLSGGDGDDTIEGGANNDLIYGDRVVNGITTPTQAELTAALDVAPTFKSWGLLYQGDNYNVNALKAADHEMIVINPAKDALVYIENSEIYWSNTEIADIKSSGKEVLGYVNLAKINTSTNDWNKDWTDSSTAPAWLADKETNTVYEVNFWEDGWDDIVFGRVQLMIDQGFDGTLLDDVLEYYFRVPDGSGTAEIVQNAGRMRDFVIDIRDFADQAITARDGYLDASNRFKLFVNGAPYIMQDALNTEDTSVALADATNIEYLNAIDYFMAENYISQNPQFLTYVKDVYGDNGVPLLSIDTDQVTQQQRLEVIKTAVDNGFMPYTTENTAYDTLNDTYYNELLADIVNQGDDVIDGGDGDDTISGAAGNDIITGGIGKDIITLGEGNDIVRYTDTVESYYDSGTGISYDDEITDFVQGEDKIDLSAMSQFTDVSDFGVYSDPGVYTSIYAYGISIGFYGDYTFTNDDFIFEGDTINGGGTTGDDLILATVGAETIDGDTGNDTVSYENATGYSKVNLFDNSQNNGFAAGDILINIENLSGSDYVDQLKGDDGKNELYGAGGNDQLFGSAEDDTLIGGLGDDALYGQNGNDDLIDGQGADTFDGGNGVDRISYINASIGVNLDLTNTSIASGAAADDVIINVEYMTGSSFDDVLKGDGFDNDIDGGEGNDQLFGRGGNDTIEGNGGNDTLYGGSGNDVIAGKNGNNVLYGESGSDVFRFDNRFHNQTSKNEHDEIADFEDGIDLIDLSAFITGIDTDGGLSEAGEIRISYDSGTNRTYIIADAASDDFSFYINGNFASQLDSSDFIF